MRMEVTIRAAKVIAFGMRFAIVGLFLAATLCYAQSPAPAPAQSNERATAIDWFDLTPKGDQLALLCVTGIKGAPSTTIWIGMYDFHEGKLVRVLPLGHAVQPISFSPSATREAASAQDFLDFQRRMQADLTFSPDQKYLIAMDWGKVWVLDFGTHSILYSVNPPDAATVAPIWVRWINNSQFAVVYVASPDHYEVCLFDLATGKRIASWLSKTAPQSFSPDGQLAAGTDSHTYNAGGVTNVALLDAHTGAKLASIPVSFHFKKSFLGLLGRPAASGFEVVRFLTDDKIVAIPDGNRDAAGHRSGDSFEVISVKQRRVIRKIRPKKYGPTGALVQSANHAFFVIDSLYANALWFAMESSNPRHFTRALMVFRRDGSAPETVIPYSRLIPLPLKSMTVARSDAILSISSNGLVVAAARYGKVLIFRLNQ
jgi:hypothetical protein